MTRVRVLGRKLVGARVFVLAAVVAVAVLVGAGCAGSGSAVPQKTLTSIPSEGLPYVTSRVYLTPEQFADLVVPVRTDLERWFVGSPTDRAPKALAWYEKKTGVLKYAVEIRIADSKDARPAGLHVLEGGYLQDAGAVREYAITWMKMPGKRPDTIPTGAQETVSFESDGRREEVALMPLLRTSGSLNQLSVATSEARKDRSRLAERLSSAKQVKYAARDASGKTVISESVAALDGRVYMTAATGTPGKPFTISLVNNSSARQLVRLQSPADVTLDTTETTLTAGSVQPVQGVGSTAGVKHIQYSAAELRADAEGAPQVLSKGPLVSEGESLYVPEICAVKPVDALDATINGDALRGAVTGVPGGAGGGVGPDATTTGGGRPDGTAGATTGGTVGGGSGGSGGVGGKLFLSYAAMAAVPIIGLLAISSKEEKQPEQITVVPEQVSSFSRFEPKNAANILVVPVETPSLGASILPVHAPVRRDTIVDAAALVGRLIVTLSKSHTARASRPPVLSVPMSTQAAPPRILAQIGWDSEIGKPCTYPELLSFTGGHKRLKKTEIKYWLNL